MSQVVSRRPVDTTAARSEAPPPPPPPPAPPPAPPATPRRQSKGLPPRPVAPRIDVARAEELLDNLLFYQLQPKTAGMVRDSATHIFNAPGIDQRDRAYAAFVLGNAFFQLNDRATGCSWVRKATELSPADTSYAKIAAACRS